MPAQVGTVGLEPQSVPAQVPFLWWWLDGPGGSRFTGPCACPNPPAGSRPECPVRLNVFTFGCFWSPGLGPGLGALFVEAPFGAVQLELSPGSTGPGEYFASPPHSLPDVPPHGGPDPPAPPEWGLCGPICSPERFPDSAADWWRAGASLKTQILVGFSLAARWPGFKPPLSLYCLCDLEQFS